MPSCAVVVAAGSGSRFGAPKQFLPLRGVPVVHHAVGAALGACDHVVVVLPEGTAWDGPAVTATVAGGATRSASVRAGLDAAPGDADILVVHDAARPLATVVLFRAVIEAVAAGADGAVPGAPVPDTLKRVRDGVVVETVPRDDLVAAQTPQAFRADVLRRAHEGDPEATDDAALVEALGARVVVVPGEARNLKLTTAADLELMAGLVDGGAR